MANRARIRVGATVAYLPTNAEATTGNGAAGDRWNAVVTAVLPTGKVNLMVNEADGTLIAKTSVSKGESKGSFSFAKA